MNIICALYDEKTQAYFGLHESPTAGHAIRAFGDHVKNPSSPMNRHPGDYKLYKLGEFDATSGCAQLDKNPIYLSSALDFVQESVSTATLDQNDRNLKSSVVGNHK